MPGAGRLGDKANVPADAHGCPACPHPGIGPAILGSPNVLINKRPALRLDDMGIHAACCGPNMWQAASGSSTVHINGKPAHRMGDQTRHCSVSSGSLIEGSTDVIIGDAGGGGGGGGGGSSGGSSGSSSTSSTSGQGQSGSVAPTSGGGATGAAGSSGPASRGAAQGALSEMPRPAQASWKVQYGEGDTVTKVRAAYEGPTGPKDVDGASGQVPGLSTTDGFALTLTGTEKLKAKLQDADGKAVPDARLRIERAFGEPVEVTTDAGGAFEVEGLLGEEYVDATLVALSVKVTGKVVDEAGAAVAGARVRLHREDGGHIDATTDADGKYEAAGFMPGEAPEGITLLSLRDRASGKLVDEAGAPVAGVKVRVQGDSGASILATTNADGKYEIDGLLPGEGYALSVEPKKS
jgi:uncharacterized Zn-binding protein involved in type VI secretion